MVEDCDVTEVQRVYSVMVRKVAARERGRRVAPPTAVPLRLLPSSRPHYALSSVAPYEFNEPLSAACTLLKLWQ